MEVLQFAHSATMNWTITICQLLTLFSPLSQLKTFQNLRTSTTMNTIFILQPFENNDPQRLRSVFWKKITKFLPFTQLQFNFTNFRNVFVWATTSTTKEKTVQITVNNTFTSQVYFKILLTINTCVKFILIADMNLKLLRQKYLINQVPCLQFNLLQCQRDGSQGMVEKTMMKKWKT